MKASLILVACLCLFGCGENVKPGNPAPAAAAPPKMESRAAGVFWNCTTVIAPDYKLTRTTKGRFLTFRSFTTQAVRPAVTYELYTDAVTGARVCEYLKAGGETLFVYAVVMFNP